MDHSFSRSYSKAYSCILSFCSWYFPHYVHYPVSRKYFSVKM